MDSLRKAVISQINDLHKANPDLIVGLVSFNGEVQLYADGSNSEPVTFSGCSFTEMSKAFEFAQQIANTNMKKSIKEASQNLINHINKLDENGLTVLGPALVSAVGLAATNGGLS